MTEQTPDIALLAERLIDGMADLSTEFHGFQTETVEDQKHLRQYGRRNRWIIAADLVATVTFAVASFLFVQARGHSDAANRKADQVAASVVAAHQTAVSNCKAGNDFRVADAKRWTDLTSQSAAPTTPAAIESLQHALTIILAPDALRDCSLIK